MNNVIKIGWRLVVIVVCALFLTASAWTLISVVSDQMEYRSWGQDMDSYEYELQDGDYRGLGECLMSYQPVGDQFQIYWDVADAYEAHSVYSFWQSVAENPMASHQDRSAANIYSMEYLTKLQEIYKRSDETAKKYIDSFAGELLR